MAESVQQQQQQHTAGPLARFVARVSPGGKYWGFRILSRLAGIVPIRLSYILAVLVGDFIYYTWHEHSANAVGNMRHVLGPRAGERAARRMARASFRNYAKTLADFIRFPHMGDGEVEARVQHHYGAERLDELRAKGKGVIAVSGHLGNWDFAGAYLGRRGLPLYAIADRFEPPKLDKLVIDTRLRNGIHVITMEASAMRMIFEALRRNEVVMLLIDRPMPGEGVPVQFFGETAWLPSGPAAIALKTGAPLVIGSCIRMRGDIRFQGGIESPIEYKQLLTGNKQADIQAITQAIACAMEALIRRAPDQWYMFRPMWPRPETATERRRARRQARRVALRRRARQLRHARPSITRLRARIRGAAPSADLSGVSLG